MIKRIIPIIFVLLVSLGTVLPLFHTGFFEFHDNTQVVRVHEMTQALSDGQFPVRWVENLGYGYGYPIFNFYSPLPYYLGGFVSLLGFSSILSTKIMIFIGMVMSGVTMYYLSRKFFGELGGIVSSVIYMYFPYHAVNLYVRGALGELFAYAFLPLIFLGVFSLIDPKKHLHSHFKTISLLAFSVFLIATSHNLTLLMLSIPLLVVLIGVFILNRKMSVVATLLVGVVLGIGLSAFYVMPAFLEMSYTNVSSQVGGSASYNSNFVCLSQFWESMWGFGGSQPGCLDGLSFRLGKGTIILTTLSIILLIFNISKKRVKVAEKVSIIATILVVLSVFLTTAESRFVWDNLKALEYVQYPWRYINFIALFSSLLIGYLVYKTEIVRKNLGLVVFGVVILVTFYQSLKLFIPQRFNNYPPSFYENKDHIRFTVSKISDEYLPVGFSKPRNLSEVPNSKFSYQGSGRIALVEESATKLKIDFDLPSNEVLHLNIAYFPAWKAYLNGEELPLIKKVDGMDLLLPEGSGSVKVTFVQTNVEIIGNVITILAFLSLLIGIIFKRRSSKSQ